MGSVRPTAGSITLDRQPIAKALRKNRIAYVPQTEEVDWHFPVLVSDVVMMGRYGRMSFLRIPSAEDKFQVKQSLNRVGLWDLRQRQIGELSGGQRKRVFLARALAQQGGVLLLDEPFTGIDMNTEHLLIGLLRSLRDEGQLILVSTHRLGNIPDYCDHVVMINRSIQAAGPVANTFTRQNVALAFGGAENAITRATPP
jgi:manganese/iron transport system ATP-binding protein